jgi:peptidoglycan/LPS O-acetylase OafA/YrhL
VLAWCAAVLALAALIGWMLARTGFAVATEHRRFAEIDGLRGFLALLVMVQHALIWAHGPPGSPDWTPPPQPFGAELGMGSVAVFFMITGFLFAPRIDQGLFGTNWAEFAMARLFRIAPLIVVSVSVVAVLIHFETGVPPVAGDAWTALMWIFGRQERLPLAGSADPGLWDAHVLWSLRWEWMFYLAVMPAWATAITLWRGGRAIVPGAVLLACLATHAVCATWGRPAPTFALFMPFFVMGYAIAALARRDAVRRALGGPSGDVLALLALAGGMAIWPDPFGFGQLLLALFLLCVACGAGLGGILRLPGALVLGECSYAIYLFHGIVLAVLFRWAPGLVYGVAQPIVLAWLLVVTALVVLIAAALHLAVEQPLMLRGKVCSKALGNVWRGWC